MQVLQMTTPTAVFHQDNKVQQKLMCSHVYNCNVHILEQGSLGMRLVSWKYHRSSLITSPHPASHCFLIFYVCIVYISDWELGKGLINFSSLICNYVITFHLHFLVSQLVNHFVCLLLYHRSAQVFLESCCFTLLFYSATGR